jgi:hypothetical protein
LLKRKEQLSFDRNVEVLEDAYIHYYIKKKG